MTELTSEMVEAALEAHDAIYDGQRDPDAIKAAIRAVFAIVERDQAPAADTVTVSARDLCIVLAHRNGHAHTRPATWNLNGLPCNPCLALGRIQQAADRANAYSQARSS